MSASDAAEAADWLGVAREWVDAELAARCARLREAGAPALLVDGLEHALLGPGKRLRPALVRLLCLELGGDEAAALPAAAGIECLHTYSLVHDDLPCMDDDDLRRGRPTVHVAFGEDLGVLVGDALQTLAFELCAEAPEAGASVACLARAAGAAGMVGGQVIDLRADLRAPGFEGLAAVHGLKTAALFGAAAELGAIAAGARERAREEAAAYGLALGRCFQVVDDVLDVTGDASTLGKTPGKDAALERDSSVALLGLEGARRVAEELADEARGRAARLGLAADGPAAELVERVLRRSR